MLDIQLQLQSTVNTNEIRNFAQNANVNIAVGFLSGKQHVETLHKKGKGKNAEYRKPAKQWENAELAKMLTFGTAKIPPRPFIEEGINAEKESIKKAIEEQLNAVKQEKKANWDKVGVMAVGAVQSFVRGDYYKTNKPNSPKTIEYKGSDTPLIDGADLINSVEYVLEE